MANEVAEVLWRVLLRHRAQLDIGLLHFGLVKRRVHGLVELVDHVLGRAYWGNQAKPRSHIERGDAAFLQRGHIRGRRRAGFGGDRQRLELARLHMRPGGGHVVEHKLHLTANQIRHRRCAALVRHVLGFQARAHLEHLARHVDGCATARRGIRDFVVVGARPGDELFDIVGRHAGVHHQNIGHLGAQRHRIKIAVQVKFDVGVQRLVDGTGHGHKQQGVAIGGCGFDGFGRNIAAAAGAVVHHKGLAQRLGQLFGHDARHHIGGAACRKAHHDAHRLAGVIRRCPPRAQGRTGQCPHTQLGIPTTRRRKSKAHGKSLLNILGITKPGKANALTDIKKTFIQTPPRFARGG